MAQILVADISRWQGTINFDQFKTAVQAVIIKSSGSDGGLYPDGKLARNRDEARRVGLPVAFYHYKGSGTAREQAEYMLGVIGEIKAGEFVVIDDENEGKVNTVFCRDFAARIKELTGLVVPVYSNLSRFQGIDLGLIKDLPAWVAKYGANTGAREDSGAAPQLDGINIVCWQYTSAARVAGVTENSVDMNVFYGSVDDFRALGAKGNVPVPASVPAPTPAPTTGNGTYTVQKNDTLSGIGGKVGVAWQTIAATNGIVAPYTIFPGQVLKVYGGTPGQAAVVEAVAGGSYAVVKNDTLSGIGAKTGHGWMDIANLNGIKAPYTIFPGQVLRLPGGGVAPAAAQEATYTVVSGDNLSVIGQKTGRNWTAIAAKNGISAPYTIYPNQVLRLP
jgi:LysM repeat protein